MKMRKIQVMDKIFNQHNLRTPKIKELTTEILELRCALVNMTILSLNETRANLKKSKEKPSLEVLLMALIVRGNVESKGIEEASLIRESFHLSNLFYSNCQENLPAGGISEAVELVASFSMREAYHNKVIKNDLSHDDLANISDQISKAISKEK